MNCKATIDLSIPKPGFPTGTLVDVVLGLVYKLHSRIWTGREALSGKE